MSQPNSNGALCPKCGLSLPQPKPAICPHCKAKLKPLFGPTVPLLLALLLGVISLGLFALRSLVAANDALTSGNPNAQGGASLFPLAFLSGAAAIVLVVWVIKRRK